MIYCMFQIKQEIFEDETDVFINPKHVETNTLVVKEPPDPLYSEIVCKASPINTESLELLSKVAEKVQSILSTPLNQTEEEQRTEKLMKDPPTLSLQKCQIFVNEYFKSSSYLVKHCFLKHSGMHLFYS